MPELAVQVVLRDYNENMRAKCHRTADGVWHLDKIEKKVYDRWEEYHSRAADTFHAVLNREVSTKRRKDDVYWPSWSNVVGHHVRAYLDKVGEL